VALAARAQGLLRHVRAGDDCNMAGLRAYGSWVEQGRPGRGALTGDRSVRSPTICPSGIFIDPATLPRTDIPAQPGSIQTQRGEVLYSRADPAIQTLLTPQCQQEVANCERDAEGYCKTPMIDPRLSAEMSNPPAPTGAPSSVSVPVPVPRPRIVEQQRLIEAAPAAAAPTP
jgi:hypothetical protein